MAVGLFAGGIEPNDPDTPVFRFLEFWKFEDLLCGHLYFRRIDRLDDQREAIPFDDDYRLLGLNPYSLDDRQTSNHHVGFAAQMRQSYYISSWNTVETLRMWHEYAPGDGVAVRSTYGALKQALEPMEADKPMLGLTRYGHKHIPRGSGNLMVHASTKDGSYAHEHEVRALLWRIDGLETGNRHIDLDNRAHDRPIYPTHNPEGIRNQVDVQKLVSEVIVSPFAPAGALQNTESWLASCGYSIPVRASFLTTSLALPSLKELALYS
jgi:hypothetical protein